VSKLKKSNIKLHYRNDIKLLANVSCRSFMSTNILP